MGKKRQKIINELEEVIGCAATEALLRAFGGMELYIPASMHRGHPIALRIGPYAADELADRFGAETLYIPAYTNTVREMRNRRICLEYLSGQDQKDIAKKYGLGVRQVRIILRAGNVAPYARRQKVIKESE
jgi:hypothetical protein